MLSPVRLSVCLSSVTLVHPTQAVDIFGNISTTFGTLAIENFTEIVPGELLRRGKLNPRGVARYSDFGRIEVLEISRFSGRRRWPLHVRCRRKEVPARYLISF